MRRPEQQLQIAVARYLSLALKPPVWWSSIDHGAGKMTRASAGLRKARGVKAGLPDILLIYPSRYGTCPIGIELKAAKGKQSEAQISVQQYWEMAGGLYFVCDSMEAVMDVLKACDVPLHASLSGKAIR